MSEYVVKVDKDKVCCKNCQWFEERTRFCRKNPPVPSTKRNRDGKEVITSLFPKITYPETDYCSFWEKNK